VHFTELKNAMNAARTLLGVGTVEFQDVLTPGVTAVKKAHLDLLRSAVK